MAGNLENKGRWEFCDLSEIREVVYSERMTAMGYVVLAYM